MNRPTRLLRFAGACMTMFAPAIVLADVPPALDRCPADAPMFVSIKSVSAFHSSLNTMATTLKVPEDALQGLKKAGDVLKLAGLNPEGSAAVAVLSLEDKGGPPPLVMVIPVKDYAAFAKGLGGLGSGVEKVKFEDEDAYVKDLGNGFAAMSPTQELADKFEGKSGHGKDIEALMGPTGKSISESCDAFLVTNMAAVGPMMKEGLEDFKNQMEMMAAMAGGGANKASFDMINAFMDGFVRDASAGLVGFKATEAGLKIDLGAQFKEGSPFAGYLSTKGKTGSLIGSLPNQAFLFALSMDTSSPGFKQIAKNIVENSKKDPEAAKVMSGMNPLESIDKIDGLAFCWGQTPALMGGLFLNTSMFAKTSDPAAYVKTMRDGFGNINGKTLQGMTYQSSYEAGGGKVGDKTVDSWSLKMTPDKDNPQSAQIAQAMMMMFGPGGLGGYVAQTDNGVVLTYGKNSDLMGKALEAAKSNNGLNAEAGVKAVAAQLPADRTLEAYIGVKSLMETAIGFMGMMGAGPANFEVPADLPPIGMGGISQGGGMRFSTFVPTKVLTTIKTLSDSMKGEGEGEPAEPAPKEKAGQPKF